MDDPNLGITSVQMGERKSSLFVPKRHQIKHLDFDLPLVRDQGVGGSNPLSPTNFQLPAQPKLLTCKSRAVRRLRRKMST